MSIGGTSFCFIAAHLASGEKKGDEGRRNHQVSVIFRRTCFQRLTEDGDKAHPLTILGHDRIFWFGDLNYRLYLEDNLARQLLKEQDWRALQKFDQLRRELDHGGVFQGWKEGNIEFAPTYKYSTYNCNRYSGGIPSRAGEKQRTPARELRNCSTFSQEVECLLCVSKIVDADGSVTGVFCFLQQASQELQQALHVQRLSEQMALKRLKVLPYMRKEIRNPLSGR